MGLRALLKVRRTPEQLADAILIPVIFTVLFTYLFGGALSGSPQEYLQDLLPGTLVLAVLLMTVYSGVGLNTDRGLGRLQRFRSLPIWQPALIVGGLIGDALRYLISGTLVIGLGLVMGFRPDGGAAGAGAAVALILVFAFALSWVWTSIGLVARTPQAVSMMSFLIQFPLTFASNAFVDPATMPDWLAHAGRRQPRQPSRHRGAGAHGRYGDSRGHRSRPRRGGRDHRGVRTADHAPLPAPDVSPARHSHPNRTTHRQRHQGDSHDQPIHPHHLAPHPTRPR